MNVKKIFSLLICVVAALLIYKVFIKTPSFSNGAKAPNINGQLIDGSDFTLEELEGDYVLLDFWGSWCPPCHKEIPELKALYRDYHGQEYEEADDFHIVSIALEKSDKLTKKIIENKEMTWPYHIIDVNPVIMLSGYAQQYDVKDLPTKFLINPNGEIIGTNLSFLEIRKMLDTRKK